jgi:hypothetical protein
MACVGLCGEHATDIGHILIAESRTEQHHTVVAIDALTATLLIATIREDEQTRRPRMTIEDIELTQDREVRILSARIRIVKNKCEGALAITGGSRRIEVSNYSTTVHDVTCNTDMQETGMRRHAEINRIKQ